MGFFFSVLTLREDVSESIIHVTNCGDYARESSFRQGYFHTKWNGHLVIAGTYSQTKQNFEAIRSLRRKSLSVYAERRRVQMSSTCYYVAVGKLTCGPVGSGTGFVKVLVLLEDWWCLWLARVGGIDLGHNSLGSILSHIDAGLISRWNRTKKFTFDKRSDFQKSRSGFHDDSSKTNMESQGWNLVTVIGYWKVRWSSFCTREIRKRTLAHVRLARLGKSKMKIKG